MTQEIERIWYIFDHGIVTGPFDQHEVRKQAGKGLNPAAMIWQKGHTDWQTISAWADHFLGWSEAWYLSHDGMQRGPYSLKDISQQLKSKETPLNVKIWTIGLRRWVSVYEVQPLVKAIGLCRRRHTRAPFVGEVRVPRLLATSLLEHTATAVSLSCGGMGLSQLKNAKEGAKLTLKIQSDLLEKAVQAKGQIVYLGEDGIAGVEFCLLSPQDEKIISNYVKQFENVRLVG